MELNDVHFSSKSDDWETPQALYDSLNERYHFELDVCASAESAKCARYFNREMDGLKQPWTGRCWMNPPYGREIGKWVKKAYETAQKGEGFVVCLLPARTDAGWFHDYCMKGRYTFLRGRLKFGNAKHNAPFPSMIVIFGGDKHDQIENP